MNQETYDIAVVGAGVAGVSFAVAAAREGAKTILITDRPMPGGNASPEVCVAPSGAINFLSFAMETGILADAMLRDREKNTRLMAETLSLELSDLLSSTQNLTVLYHNRVIFLQKDGKRLTSVTSLGLQDGVRRVIRARAFADCTGDGEIARMAGAEAMYGREGRELFGEHLAPEKADNRVMGTTVLFAARRTDRPVPFTPPSWAKKLTEKDFNPAALGEVNPGGEIFKGFWWLELGGERHTVREADDIARDLYAWVYGLWDYLKNSPQRAEAFRNYELYRVSAVPGKRESYRVVGDHILTEGEVKTGGDFKDAISTGGWYIDLHNPGSFADPTGKTPLCHDFTDPVYENYALVAPFGLPLRSFICRDLDNLWLGGRDLSASHVAFGAARVQCTLACSGEACGIAAAMALKHEINIHKIASSPLMKEIQNRILEHDVRIPGIRYPDPLLKNAKVTAAPGKELSHMEPSGESMSLDSPRGLVFPVTGRLGRMTAAVEGEGEVAWRLARLKNVWDQSEGEEIASGNTRAAEGRAVVKIEKDLPAGAYRLELTAPGLAWKIAKTQPCGVLSQHYFAFTEPGITPQSEALPPAYTAWNCPRGKRYALCCDIFPAQHPYEAENLLTGYDWQDALPNLWLPAEKTGEVTLTLPEKTRLSGLSLTLDADLNRNITVTQGRAPTPEKVEIYLDGNKAATLLHPVGRLHTLSFPETEVGEITLRVEGGGVYGMRIIKQ